MEHFTVEECEYFQDAFASRNFPKILRKKTNTIILKADGEFKDEIPILKPLQHTGVQDSMNITYLILTLSPGTTAIITNDHTNIEDSRTTRFKIPTTKELIPQEVKQLAGDMAIQTLNTQRTSRRISKAPVVKIAIITENLENAADALSKCNSFVDSVKKKQVNRKLPDPTQIILYDECTATCHCNRPDVKSNETILCSSCKILTHKKCIKEETHIFDIKSGDYKYATCSINVEGVLGLKEKAQK
jgi:hypothetical protein